jgi:hypothetical protein
MKSQLQLFSAGDSHTVQVDYYVQWVDPINLRVSWVQLDATVQWFEAGLFCNQTSGGSFLDGALWASGWARYGSAWNVGYTNSCNVSGYTGSVRHINGTFPGCNFNPAS